MFELREIVNALPYSLGDVEKESLHNKLLPELIRHHYRECPPYRRILDALRFDPTIDHDRKKLPFLPVGLFKSQELLSVHRDNIVRTLTSSGTSGKGLSKVYLDRVTAHNQKKALSRIVTELIGNKRLPLLVIDSPSVVSDRKNFAARGAAVLGFSMFAKNVTYALSESMEPDWPAIEKFCLDNSQNIVLVFGFTFVIWNYLVKKLIELNRTLELNDGVLIHGGGWKKALEQAVNHEKFKKHTKEYFGLDRVHNYYGLVEQTGSVFFECEYGYFHCSILSDVAVLDEDFHECEFMQEGILKLTSLLPTSYPGNIVITEDLGRVVGEDSCSCGRLGKYFQVHGRVPGAETRGCSDTRS